MVSAQPMTLWTVNFREKHVLLLLLLVFPFFHRNCNYHLSVYFLKGFEITITMLTFIRVVNRYANTCPLSCWHTFFAFWQISSRKRKISCTIFACSYGVQAEFFVKKGRKSHDTVPLNWALYLKCIVYIPGLTFQSYSNVLCCMYNIFPFLAVLYSVHNSCSVYTNYSI